jgi:enoyl-CoA hydratase/carnithine racemase
VGQQAALEMLYTGARLTGEQAFAIGLCDRLVPSADLGSEARALAGEIAASAPLAVRSIRRTMRTELADRVEAVLDREDSEQVALRKTDDFAEGTAASLQRRPARFSGR